MERYFEVFDLTNNHLYSKAYFSVGEFYIPVPSLRRREGKGIWSQELRKCVRELSRTNDC